MQIVVLFPELNESVLYGVVTQIAVAGIAQGEAIQFVTVLFDTIVIFFGSHRVVIIIFLSNTINTYVYIKITAARKNNLAAAMSGTPTSPSACN